MKLENFNEAFERMLQDNQKQILTEAADRKDAVNNRFEKLNKLKEVTVKSLSNLDLSRDIDKLNNYATVLDWICKLCKSFKNLSNENDNNFIKKLKYADQYIEQIAKAIQGGQVVHESLMKESLNYLEK